MYSCGVWELRGHCCYRQYIFYRWSALFLGEAVMDFQTLATLNEIKEFLPNSKGWRSESRASVGLGFSPSFRPWCSGWLQTLPSLHATVGHGSHSVCESRCSISHVHPGFFFFVLSFSSSDISCIALRPHSSLLWSVFVCLCVCVRAGVCVHPWGYVYVHVCVLMCVCPQVHAYMYAGAQTHVCTWMWRLRGYHGHHSLDAIDFWISSTFWFYY